MRIGLISALIIHRVLKWLADKSHFQVNIQHIFPDARQQILDSIGNILGIDK
jgi:hypothetical protein